jgi:hypothetical protein
MPLKFYSTNKGSLAYEYVCASQFKFSIARSQKIWWMEDSCEYNEQAFTNIQHRLSCSLGIGVEIITIHGKMFCVIKFKTASK